MKIKSVYFSSLLLTGTFLSAQMPGMMTMQSSAPQGTSLGANTTSGAAGIALGNRVVMRGYVDFIFNYEDIGNGAQTEKFDTAADIDFLFDFSPLTAEIHFNATNSNSISATTTRTNPTPGTNTYSTTGTADGVGIEQAYGRYAFNRDFNISFGRQLTALGYEADEAPGLYSVTNAYRMGVGRSYVDGVRANFNNGRFGLTLGLHDNYFGGVGDDTFNSDKIAIDLAASFMIIPGLEAQLGYANQDADPPTDDWSQFNAWIAYNPGDLTLAFEYDNADKGPKDYWSMLLLANYQFNEMFAATFKYSHEDEEAGNSDVEADRFTFALLFTITQNLFFNVEYSHSEVDAVSDYDVEEFYLEALLTF